MVEICVMMNLKNYAQKVGKMNKLTYSSINPKRRINGNFVFVTKTKTPILNAPLKQHLPNKQNVNYN